MQMDQQTPSVLLTKKYLNIIITEWKLFEFFRTRRIEHS
ncbi:g160 [Yersinia phage fHe-Yen9-04]|uniref:G160 protein n=2 Tax=Eneladusvirus Yen904 TaxID=2560849 RepID=A0A2C9CX96_9CAUD|nr:hypothetical protein FDJ41_gp160 [Yersinia phage fHe-Yen9-04]SOK58437.1 g160 [Yersinia phage fHe-Yen9-04]SOK58971.1 hypothetical protein [Yersinia phage fHe-Yen9-03]VUE36206.1 g160 [Yersinia phage fHe-Yen9-04]